MDGIVKKLDAQADNGQPIHALPIPVSTPCLVHKELSILDTSKSLGHDKLHSKMLKWLATLLVEPMIDLFNNSHATVCVPNGWKAAIIIF